jgi:hypothetical protein
MLQHAGTGGGHRDTHRIVVHALDGTPMMNGRTPPPKFKLKFRPHGSGRGSLLRLKIPRDPPPSSTQNNPKQEMLSQLRETKPPPAVDGKELHLPAFRFEDGDEVSNLTLG